MKKNKLMRVMAVAAIAAMGMTACQNTPKMDEKPEAANAGASELKIAFVEVDSIMTQYNFCKDYQKILEKRATNIQNALAAQEQNLNAAAQNFQNKLNNNGFSSRQEAESQQAAIQRQQEQLIASRDRLAAELQSETNKFNTALHDSLEHFITKYVKDKKYTYILTKQGDNILYAAPALDITKEVIAGLNKAYKSKPTENDVKKDDKKETPKDTKK